jgi:FkbM family methyltransferase
MFSSKFLTYELDTEGLSINHIATMHYNVFTRKDYDWWYEILPDDVVVDIGAGIGIFTAKALDARAEKVYMIEPNKRMLKTAIKNVSEAFINTTQPRVIPINAAMGRTDVDLTNIFKSSIAKEYDEEPKLMSLRELIDTYEIGHIDYLKIDACGAEYSILHETYMDILTEKVRHIAVRCYLNAQYGSMEKFAKWRDGVLKQFIEQDKVRFQDASLQEKLFHQDWSKKIPSEFMLYIKNW